MKHQLSPAKLLERDIQGQIKDFLRWRGWRIIRHQVAVATSGTSTFSTGEKGMPDLQAIYYFDGPFALTLTLWIETKRPKKDLLPDQVEWKRLEVLRGAKVWRADSIVVFEREYERVFNWIHTDDRVRGQKAFTFDELTTVALTAAK